MKSLVLGGTSFVGGALTARLLNEGDEVYVLNRGNTAPLDGVLQLRGNRKDLESLRGALGDGEWDRVFDVSGYVMATDAITFDGLLDLLAGRVGRYTYVSSIMVYEPTGFMPWTEDMAKRQDSVTTYGGFKVHAERSLAAQRERGAFGTSVVRPGAIYGPGNNIYDMEAAMFHRLCRGLPVFLPNHGLVVGSYGHIDDLVDAMVLASTHPAADGEAFNVCEEGVTSGQCVRTLAQIVGVEPDIIEIEEEVADRYGVPLFGHMFRRRHHGTMSSRKIKDTLGLPDGLTFEEGHRRTFQWFQDSDLAGQFDNLVDPLWGSGFDLAGETRVADELRAVR